MFPCSCSQLNIVGRFQDDKFILAPIFEFGKILGKFSVIPPPVILEIAFIPSEFLSNSRISLT